MYSMCFLSLEVTHPCSDNSFMMFAIEILHCYCPDYCLLNNFRSQSPGTHEADNPLVWEVLLSLITSMLAACSMQEAEHDDVMTWKCSPHYCSCVWGIQQLLVNSPQKESVIDSFFVRGGLRCHNIIVMNQKLLKVKLIIFIAGIWGSLV